MTPCKNKKQTYNYISDEMGSPVLDSAARSNMQYKSFLSSTPACNHAEAVTPRSKTTVLNILDQLCSPISMEETEARQFDSSVCEKALVISDRKNTLIEVPKTVSTVCKKLNINNSLNKYPQQTTKGSLEMTQNDLFDDISDISLQILCDATNHIVDNPKSNDNVNINIRNMSDHECFHEDNKYSCANNKKDEPIASSPKQPSLKCNNERSELIDTLIFSDRKLIYSNTNVKSDAPSSIHLNDLFAEVKFLEEANRCLIKKELKPKDSCGTYKTIQNKFTTFNDLSNKKEDAFQSSSNFSSIQSKLENETKILNDSLGISDTQFCEAVEVAELMSNVDTSFSVNVKATGNITETNNINSMGEEGHNLETFVGNETFKRKISFDRIKAYNNENRFLDSDSFDSYHALKQIEPCINNIKSEIPQSSSSLDIEWPTSGRFAPDTNTGEDLLLCTTKRITSKEMLKNLQDKRPTNQSNTSDKVICNYLPKTMSHSAECNSEIKQTEEKILQSKNWELFEIPKKIEMEKPYLIDARNITSVSKTTIFQTQAKLSIEISEKSSKKAEEPFSEVTEPVLNVCQTSSVKSLNKSENLLKEANNLLTGVKNQPDTNKKYDPIPSGKPTETPNELLPKDKSLSNTLEAAPKGFKTASGKVVKVSEKSMVEAKHFFDDASYELNVVPKDSVVIEKRLNKAKSLLHDVTHASEPLLTCLQKSRSNPFSEKSLVGDKNSFNHTSCKVNTLQEGLQTASGKSVNISDALLVKAKDLLEDLSCESDLILEGFKIPSSNSVEMSEKGVRSAKNSMKKENNKSEPLLKGFQTAIRPAVKMSGKSLYQAKQLFYGEQKQPQTGLQSATEKFVSILEQSPRQAKNLPDKASFKHPVPKDFHMSSCTYVETLKEESKHMKNPFYQEAAKESVKVSEEALEKANDLFDDRPYLIQEGFRTASEKSVQVSEKALEQVRNLFDDGPNSIQKGFQTASGKLVQVSEKSLEQARHLFDDGSNSIQKGFQTASGKSVQVSEKSLEQARHLFDDGLNSIQKGFQTASGKSVQVSEKSLEQAKHLFDDASNLIQKGFQTASGKSVQLSEKSLEQARHLFDDGPNSIQNGFQTASGKSVQVSEKSLEQARHLFDDGPSSIQKGFQTASGKSVQVSEKSLEQAKHLFDDASNLIQKGFQTASGKSVQVSEKSLEQARHLFDDGPNSIQKGFQTASGKSVQVSEKSLEQVRHLFDDGPNSIQKGFQTASGKSVQVSEKSLEQARHLFDDGPSSIQKGFQTASGKSVQVSEKSLEQAKHLFDDASNLIQKGFQTASGKSVQVSEKSLEQARHLFDDGPNSIQKGFQTASGKSVQVSEKSLEQARHLFDDVPNSIQNGFQTACGKSVQVSEKSLEQARHLFDDGPCSIQKGFQTASGKSVQVSEKSLEQAKNLFDDASNLIQKGFQTASGKSVQVSEKSLEQARHLFDDGPNSIQKGFQTASGKAVQVSEKSLEQARHLFDDGPNMIQKGFCGVLVEVSEEFLKKTKHLLDDEPNLIQNCFKLVSENPSEKNRLRKEENLFFSASNESKHVGKEFQTVGGKSIKLSEELLEKAMKLHNDTDCKPNSIPKSFQTASGKCVKISEESLKKAKKLLDDISCESSLSQAPTTFSSTNFNHISEETLSKYNLLSVNHVNEVVLKGFQTGGGKCFDIVEHSLSKAENMLDYECPSKPQQKLVLNDFQTASGKRVQVSEESLEKTKNWFRDEDYNKYEDGLIVFKKSVKEPVNEPNDSQRGSVLSEDTEFPKRKSFTTLSSGEVHDARKLKMSCPVVHEEHGSVKTQAIEITHHEVRASKRKHSQSDCHSQKDRTLNSLSLNHPLLEYVKKSRYCSMKKRRKLFTETDTSNQGNEDKFFYNEESNSLVGTSVISEADLCLLNQSRTNLSGNETQISELGSPNMMSPSVAREVSESMAALLADEASDSPFSLKPCISSPGMLYDRQVNLPSIDCYENEVRVKQLSPILDSHCNFKCRKRDKHQIEGVSTPVTRLNKTTDGITKSSTFKPPYATSTPNESYVQSKRKSLFSNIHAPTEKRQKTALSLEKEIVYDISQARLQAAYKQEQSVKEKLKNHKAIKPCKGLYLLRKQTEKSRSLIDITANGPPSLPTTQQLIKLGVKKSVIEVTMKNCMEFKFVASDYFSNETASTNINGIPTGDGTLLILDGEGKAGVKEITRAFLASPSIDPTLVSSEWVENHFKWIVLKMAGTERMFPREFGNRYLTPNNVMLQLKYRYDREIDRSQRPALRKILEKDESPAKTMVLFVADILNVEVQPDKEKIIGRKELELSDGWYSVKATIDHEMEMLIRSGKVKVGTKLLITGAEMGSNEAGCHPLETPVSVRLRVSTNSTRRARWFARLGFHARSPRQSRLREVLGRGGALPALTATVARTYPVLFLEKVDGKTVIRCERAEQVAADEYQTRRQQCAETILSQLQHELERSRVGKKPPATRTSVKHATSTKHLYSLLEGVDDVSFLQDVLSKDQMNEIQQLKEEEMRKDQQQLQDKLVDRLDKELPTRSVTRMLKVRLVDEEEQADRSALLTVWNPSDDVMGCVVEGTLLTFYNIVASGYSRFGELQLTAGKQTKYSVKKHTSDLRSVTSLAELQDSELKPRFSEVDIVGLVVHSTDSTPDKNSRLVYIADTDHNFLGISFWTDLKATGYANTLSSGSLVAASNLHWRSHLVSWKLPSAYATEMSTFSQHPRQPHLQRALTQLRDRLQSKNLAKYMESCQDRIKSLAAQRNCGGARSGSSFVEGSTETAIVKGPSDSSAVGATPTNRRLEMLERYGEPPPIPPLSTTTPTSVKRSFRPPTRRSDKR